MLDCYTYAHRSVSLSATMISDDDFVTKMHNLAYPTTERFEGGAYKRYVDVQVALYSLGQSRMAARRPTRSSCARTSRSTSSTTITG